MGNDVGLYKEGYSRWLSSRPQNQPRSSSQFMFIFPAMSVTKDEVSDLIKANNDKLIPFFKDLLSDTIQQIKRANDTKAEEHLTEIQKLKYNEPHKFKKRANEDQYKFNLKMAETIDSAESATQKSQLEKVKSDLEEDEKLLSERQKHILLADKLEFGWCTVDEYKQNDLVDDSDDEKRIYSAERRIQAALRSRLVCGHADI